MLTVQINSPCFGRRYSIVNSFSKKSMISSASSNIYFSESMASGRDQTACYRQNTDRTSSNKWSLWYRVPTRESAYVGPVGLGKTKETCGLVRHPADVHL